MKSLAPATIRVELAICHNHNRPLSTNIDMVISIRILAITLLFLNGFSAVAGGVGLIGDPTGKSLGWSTDMLQHSPFNDFLVPGLVLFAGNGLLSIAIAVMTIKRRRYHAALIIIQGMFLCSWIIIQMVMLQLYHPLHLTCGGIGILLILCGYLLSQNRLSKVSGIESGSPV